MPALQIANPPPGKSPYVDASRHAHRGEYIEVYSQNISTRYSEVHWTMHPPVALPAEFVERYKGKVVAITGYEPDSVRLLPDGTEEHVPLYEQYNHHHCAYIHGARSKLVDVGPGGSARTVDGHGPYKGRWEARAKPLTTAQQQARPPAERLEASRIPNGAFLVDGNGGECKCSRSLCVFFRRKPKEAAAQTACPCTARPRAPRCSSSRRPNFRSSR
eukprot:COSAG04_NODE_103_length_26181_cov_19.804616_12_plen_217_part_00